LVSVGWVHVRDGKLLAVRSRGRDRFFRLFSPIRGCREALM
jgi:hypothetical protein